MDERRNECSAVVTSRDRVEVVELGKGGGSNRIQDAPHVRDSLARASQADCCVPSTRAVDARHLERKPQTLARADPEHAVSVEAFIHIPKNATGALGILPAVAPIVPLPFPRPNLDV